MGRKSNRNRKGNVGQTNDVGVRVVLAYRFSAPATEADLTREMKRKASLALREDSLQMIRDGDDVVVGNNEGFILLREMRRQDEELRELKEELERPHWFAKMVRQHFLLTYKRDKLHTASDEDCDLIRKVNKKVHGGDALADAELYGNWGRRDYDVYKKLYGVHPKDIAKYYVSQGMDIIDEHATSWLLMTGSAHQNLKSFSKSIYGTWKLRNTLTISCLKRRAKIQLLRGSEIATGSFFVVARPRSDGTVTGSQTRIIKINILGSGFAVMTCW